MTRIIDTSVVVKWFVSEEGQREAEALIGQPLVAPDLLLIEVSNAAWKKWRAGEIGAEQAALAQSLIESFVELVPSPTFAASALQIALELDHPVYDCFYLAMAQEHGMNVITSDKRLAVRCSGTRFAQYLTPLGNA